MNKAKKQKLEANGWKFGNTGDFLNLTPEESAYVEIKLKLSNGLKKQRQKKNITQQELAKLIKSSQSRVAKMEAGDSSVSIDLLVRSLLAIGTSQKTVGQILSHSQQSTAA